MKQQPKPIPNSIITPFVALLVTWTCLGFVAHHVEQNKYNPSTKSFRLM